MNEYYIYAIYLISVVVGITLIFVMLFNLRFRYLKKRYHNVEMYYEDFRYREIYSDPKS